MTSKVILTIFFRGVVNSLECAQLFDKRIDDLLFACFMMAGMSLSLPPSMRLKITKRKKMKRPIAGRVRLVCDNGSSFFLLVQYRCNSSPIDLLSLSLSHAHKQKK
jgi:hypothetical protein